MVARYTLAAIEVFLIGLDIRLIVFSFAKKHYDAILAEISYLLFVAYAVAVEINNRHLVDHLLSFGFITRLAASVIGIVGLVRVVKRLSSLAEHTSPS